MPNDGSARSDASCSIMFIVLGERPLLRMVPSGRVAITRGTDIAPPRATPPWERGYGRRGPRNRAGTTNGLGQRLLGRCVDMEDLPRTHVNYHPPVGESSDELSLRNGFTWNLQLVPEPLESDPTFGDDDPNARDEHHVWYDQCQYEPSWKVGR